MAPPNKGRLRPKKLEGDGEGVSTRLAGAAVAVVMLLCSSRAEGFRS